MLTSEQCRVGRAFLGLTQTEFASLAKIAVESVQGFERGRLDLSERSILKLRTAFVREGIEFLDDEDGIGIRRKLKLDELDRLVSGSDLQPFKVTGPDVLSAAECRGARSLLGWSREEASQRAGIRRQVMSGFDSGARVPVPENRRRIKQAFVDGGVIFERGGQRSRLTMLDPTLPTKRVR